MKLKYFSIRDLPNDGSRRRAFTRGALRGAKLGVLIGATGTLLAIVCVWIYAAFNPALPVGSLHFSGIIRYAEVIALNGICCALGGAVIFGAFNALRSKLG